MGWAVDVKKLDDDTKLFRVVWDLTAKNHRKVLWGKWKSTKNGRRNSAEMNVKY